jgi:hypothetical protein
MSGAELVVVHPQTGEVLLEPERLPTDRLADVSLALKQRESELRAMRRELDAELRRRFDDELRERGLDATDPKALGRVLIAGDFEVRVTGGRERVWDADELEHALRDLIDAGELHARDVVDVIEHATIVHGAAAKRLLDRLSGETWHAVRACHTWQRKGDGRGYVRVDRAVALLPEGHEGNPA